MSKTTTVVLITQAAKASVAKLPVKARRGLLEKAKALESAADPRKACKVMSGPLRGYYSIRYGRYRALYSVKIKEHKNGDLLIEYTVRVVLAGMRKEGDRQDVYRLAQKLADLGLLDDLE